MPWRFGLCVQLSHWRKCSGKCIQSRGTETHTQHVEAIQGQAAWASLLLPSAEGAQESHPPALCLYQSTAGPALLSCSQDPNCVPDLLWYKADSTRIIQSPRLEKTSEIIKFKGIKEMVVQIYNLEFKDNIGGAVEYLKTQRWNAFGVGLTRVWSCCARYSTVAHIFLPFSHSDCNTSFPSSNLNAHTLGIQCIKPSKLFLSQNTDLFLPCSIG